MVSEQQVWSEAPPGTRIYAIGDVHGRLDLVLEMERMIEADLNRSPPARPLIVYVGDYIDRGPDSRLVVEYLSAAAERGLADGVERVYLKGNHEALAMDQPDDPEVVLTWIENGGGATLESYGVAPPAVWGYEGLIRASAEFQNSLGDAHRRFYNGLRDWHREGDYLFVHAGIRPGVPLTRQEPMDLFWIRENFFNSEEDHGVMVVHGHTVFADVQVKSNRISLDTGACFTGRLSAAVLEGKSLRLLQTGGTGLMG